ncbi:PepSY domain-containing protein [Reyranella sp.]|uniref:PepSY domain-containing protein n=1 Tax=Reyranella sp. TaxID=1929291 RepID=UPI003D0F6BD9
MKLVSSLAAGLVLSATMAVAQMPPTTGTSTTPAAPPAGMPGTAQTATSARTQIEASGYTNIKDLKRRDDGSWQATATKNDTEVAVSVDTSGSVTQMSR